MAQNSLDETTKNILLGLAVFFAILIGIVVVVGLVKGQLDPFGVATLLGGIFTGIVTGVLYRKGGGDERPPSD